MRQKERLNIASKLAKEKFEKFVEDIRLIALLFGLDSDDFIRSTINVISDMKIEIGKEKSSGE